MKRKKKIFIGVGIASVLFAFLIFIQSRDEVNPPITLQDGSVLYFRGVTYGTNHVYRSSLAKMIRFLPGSFQTNLMQRFPDHIQIIKGTLWPPAIIVWLDRKFATNSPPALVSIPPGQLFPMGSQPDYTHIELFVVATGQEFVLTNRQENSFINYSQGAGLAPFLIETWPENSELLEGVVDALTIPGGIGGSSGGSFTNEFSEAGRFRFRNPEFESQEK